MKRFGKKLVALMLSVALLAGVFGCCALAEEQVALPYEGEEVTFSYFWFDFGDDYAAKAELPMVKAIQEKMGNVSLDVQSLPITDYYTKVPLLMATGELPDIMIIPEVNNYLTNYGPNGIFLDWNTLIDVYMPNIKGYTETMTMFSTLEDSEGHMYALPIYVNSEDYIMQTWLYNATLLDELGIAVPQTQEEFLTACRTVLEKTGMTPIQRRWGLTQLMDSVGMMYQTQGDRKLDYYPAEGKWYFGPTKENSEFKSYIEFMHLLWEENLIDHEINTMTDEQYNDYMAKGQFAFSHDYQSTYAKAENYANEIRVMPTPRGTGSLIGIDSMRDGKCVWGVVSNVNVKNAELLAACIDLFFSPEVADIENYGILGDTYEIDENGMKVFTDKISSAYNYYSGTATLDQFGANGSAWMRTFGVTDVNSTRLNAESPEIYNGVNGIIDLLDKGEMTPRYTYSYPTLTDEENSLISDTMTPVTTYLDECIVKFIMGDMDIETEWDSFMETLQGYGDIEAVCELLNSKEMPAFQGNWR